MPLEGFVTLYYRLMYMCDLCSHGGEVNVLETFQAAAGQGSVVM